MLLKDYIVFHGPESYNNYQRSLGNTGRGRNLSIIKKSAKNNKYHFMGESCNHTISDSIVFPILASYRYLLKDTRSGFKWKIKFDEVLKVVDESLGSLIVASNDRCSEEGYNFTKVGKQPSFWKSLLNINHMAYMNREGK
jgi:hypothetical protein